VHAAALKFLYVVTLNRPEAIAYIPRMRVPMHVPVVLTPVEVAQLLGALATDKHRVMAMLAYGSGLRVSEVCKLRVQDIDPKRMLVHVRYSIHFRLFARSTYRQPAPRPRRGPPRNESTTAGAVVVTAPGPCGRLLERQLPHTGG
jgi:integrase